MLKETITYTDYNGVTRVEDFWFNLSEAELLEMQLGVEGGFTDYIQKIVNANDTPSLIKLFKDLILKSYGEKSPDGRRFIKSPELSEAFSQTEAYSQLYMKLALSADEASRFVNGVVPSKYSKAGKANNVLSNPPISQ